MPDASESVVPDATASESASSFAFVPVSVTVPLPVTVRLFTLAAAPLMSTVEPTGITTSSPARGGCADAAPPTCQFAAVFQSADCAPVHVSAPVSVAMSPPPVSGLPATGPYVLPVTTSFSR